MRRLSLMDRRALAVLGWVAAQLALCLALSWAAGLTYVQRVIWPTDLYAFERIAPERFDVALVGSSRSTFGLPPSAIDACLQSRLGRPTRSFNLARVFANLFAQQKVVENLLGEGRLPRVLVVEVSPEILSVDFFRERWNWAENADLFDIPDCLGIARDQDDLLACAQPLVRGLTSVSRLLAGRHRDATHHLTWMMLYHGGGQYCFGDAQCEGLNAAYERELAGRWDGRTARVLPTLAESRFGGFRVGAGVPHERLLWLARWARDLGVELVLMEMPVHRSYRDRIPETAFRQYRDYLTAFAREWGAGAFLAGDDPRFLLDRSLYVDPDHLAPAGAERLAWMLCDEHLAPRLGAPGPAPDPRVQNRK